MTAKRLYRQLNKAARLSCRGDISAYLADKIRIDAIARALGNGIDIERVNRAALTTAIASVEARV